MKQLTSSQAARRAGVTDGRIRQLLLAGLLDGEKAGRDWRVTAESVERYRRSRVAVKAFKNGGKSNGNQD